jgi:isocitrate/isopropylmalate dehydrogenase
MLFWGIIAPDIGVKTIAYPMAMLLTIAVWLVVSPLIAAAIRVVKRGWFCCL